MKENAQKDNGKTMEANWAWIFLRSDVWGSNLKFKWEMKHEKGGTCLILFSTYSDNDLNIVQHSERMWGKN